MASQLAAAAHVYAERLRWPVFPCRGKIPLTSHGVKDATLDHGSISRWWHTWPNANVAIAAGKRAGWWALDVDGEEGAETLAALERQHGELPLTPRQLTPRGGEHILFRYVDGVRNRVRFAPGLDLRSDGGYIVAAPSALPPLSRPWAWNIDHHPTGIAPAPAPDWLLDLVRQDDRPLPGREWLPVALDTVPEGRRNTTTTSVIGHLLRQNVAPDLALELLSLWNQAHNSPPLEEKEVVKIYNSIAYKEFIRHSRSEDE